MPRVAIVGAGMTKFMRRTQETGKELAWEAAKMALDSCEMKLGDIDDVVLGTAPDAFDMIHMKSEYLTDGCGGWHKPYVRGYVGGGTGVFIANQGWYHVASGLFDTCLVVAEEKMSSCLPHPQGAFITIWDQFTESPLGPSLLWYFAMEMNRYMDRYGFTERDMALSAVKNKRNAMGHPCAQLPMELTVDDVVNSEVMAWPVKRLDVSPTSDGAVALVLAAEHVAKRISDKPVWIEGVGWNLETFYVGQRDLYYPKQVEFAARQAYQMAGIKEPDKEIDVVEPYDPFDYKEFQHLEALLLCGKGESPKLMADGVFNRDGRLPSCPSGGALGVGNAIAATGTMYAVKRAKGRFQENPGKGLPRLGETRCK